MQATVFALHDDIELTQFFSIGLGWMTRPRSFPYHGLTDVEVEMGCLGIPGGMGSVLRSAVTPNKTWYRNHATR